MRCITSKLMRAAALGALLAASAHLAVSPTAAETALDTSRLARVAGAKETYASPATTIFTSPDTVPATAAAAAKLLAADGWQLYEDPFSSRAGNPSLATMTFKKGRQGLSVFVTVAPAQANATSVSYMANAIADDLPFLADASEIKYAPDRPHLALVTGTPLDTALVVLREELATRGWAGWSRPENRKAAPGEDASEPNERGRFAFFVREGQGRLKGPLMLQLQARDDGRLNVSLERVPEKILTLLVAKEDTPDEAQAAAAAPGDTAPDSPNAIFDALAGEILNEVRKVTGEAMADIRKSASQAKPAPDPVPRTAEAVEAAPAGTAPTAPEPTFTEPTLTAEDKAGLPVPAPHSLSGSEKSLFRLSVHASVPASVETVLAFYRRTLAARGWTEAADTAVATAESAEIAYATPDGPALLKLARKSSETTVTLTLRKENEARRSGLLPSSGRTRLLFGNVMEEEAVLTIGEQKVKIGAGSGAEKPDGPSIEIAPGTYTVRTSGASAHTEQIEVAAGDIWGLMVGPGGVLALPMY